MSLPEPLAPLLDAAAYAHDCPSAIELVETHISWVLLTGAYAYKLKKPVQFAFVDFSTLERREHFCREELRCNRQFAPSLYLDVVAVTRDADGRLRMGGDGEVVEWAVKMRQFPPESELDRVLERGELKPGMLEAFGVTLAGQHRSLPVKRCPANELAPRVLQPVEDNFDDLLRLDWVQEHRPLLDAGRRASREQVRRHHDRLIERLQDGWIRECHGDLHLTNLVLLEDGVTAFDCLEFNEDLRWIDPQNDTAFLFMDCLVRGRADLAYAFVDGYLDASGDYAGVTLLPFYAAYRSMVRAKVAALRRGQAQGEAAAALAERMLMHARWAADHLERPPAGLVLMCGLSGSGKSYLARRLVPRLPALRLRSDVARKALAGLRPRESGAAAVGEGLYSAGRSDAVYAWLGEIAEDLLRSGEWVIVDATFLEPQRRATLLDRARAAGAAGTVVFCDAPADTLRERVRRRARDGDDPSDAGLDVLEHQLATFEPPGQDVMRMDMGQALDEQRLDALCASLRARAEH